MLWQQALTPTRSPGGWSHRWRSCFTFWLHAGDSPFSVTPSAAGRIARLHDLDAPPVDRVLLGAAARCGRPVDPHRRQRGGRRLDVACGRCRHVGASRRGPSTIVSSGATARVVLSLVSCSRSCTPAPRRAAFFLHHTPWRSTPQYGCISGMADLRVRRRDGGSATTYLASSSPRSRRAGTSSSRLSRVASASVSHRTQPLVRSCSPSARGRCSRSIDVERFDAAAGGAYTEFVLRPRSAARRGARVATVVSAMGRLPPPHLRSWGLAGSLAAINCPMASLHVRDHRRLREDCGVHDSGRC